MEIGNLLFGNSRGNFEIDREEFSKCYSYWNDLLETIHCSVYGFYNGKNKEYETKTGGFKCDLFEINPYYWGECTCGADDFDDNREHSVDCLLVKPNFIYSSKNKKMQNLTIKWYKYPFRDAYSNRAITPEEFNEILLDCLSYAKKLKLKE